VVHAPLLLMKLPLKSYDTNFHIFFASHYAHHWFDPWNPKWYAGFSQTTYPPFASAMDSGDSPLSLDWTSDTWWCNLRPFFFWPSRLPFFQIVGERAGSWFRGSC